MKMIKKVTISIILSVLVVMFFMPPAVTFAFNDDLKSVYTVDGKRYIDINGETYQYLSLSDFTPVEDEELIALLENSSSVRSVYDPANLPVPPTYSKDLSKGAYTGTVDLTKGDQWSPIFKRDIQKRYTNFKVDSVLNKYISIIFCVYDAYQEKWLTHAETDMKFNVLIPTYQFQHSTAGDAAQGIRILFFDFDNSPRQFQYTLTDTSITL